MENIIMFFPIIFITSTIVWPQVNNGGGGVRWEYSPTHQQKIGLKIY